MKNKGISFILCLIMLLISTSAFAGAYDQEYYEAVKSNKLYKVKELLKSGKVQLNTLRYSITDSQGRTRSYTVSPLAVACARYAISVATFLINEGADLSGTYGGTPALALACDKAAKDWESYYLPLIKLMLDKGANPNQRSDTNYTALMTAAWNNSQRVVKLLLKYGAIKQLKNKQGKTAADLAKHFGYVELANFLNDVSNEGYKKTLFHAAKTGNLKLASQILREAGSNALALLKKQDEGSDKTALYYASKYGKIELAKLLLSYGAPVAGDKSLPLRTSLYNRHIDMAFLLLQFGGDPNETLPHDCDKRNTPFAWATYLQQDKLVKAMWDTGKVNKFRRLFYFVNSLSTLKVLVEYCKLKPSQEFLSDLKKWLSGEKKMVQDKLSLYREVYNYLRNRGFYNNEGY